MAAPNLHQGLHARTEQQLLLQPRMLQSIEVLQLATHDLEAWLQDAAAENEALQLEMPNGEERSESAAPRGSMEATERHDQMLRNQPERERGLTEHLEEQLALFDGEGDEVEWLRFLIARLDQNGYLSTSDDELLLAAEEAGLSADPTALGRAIAQLQRFEPVGIGGRDMVEALLLQLDQDEEEYGLFCRLLEEFLEDIAANRLPAVARGLGIEMPELAELLLRLRDLDPRPGAEHEVIETPVLRPDVVVERGEDGAWTVRVERSQLPTVSLDPELVTLAKSKDSSQEVRGWARDRVERARWIVDAVGQRSETLLRVATSVFDRQRAFLEEGPGHLQPLTMSSLAEELELHLSTISRTVGGKYVQCPWGILSLRHFFQTATTSASAPTRDDLREVVREVFAQEDPEAPLSDEEVAEELERRGHPVARRTVAKFRKELSIPSSYRRRKYT